METLTVRLRQKSQQNNLYNQACKMLLPCRLLVLKCKIKKNIGFHVTVICMSKKDLIHEHERVRQIQYIKITKAKQTKQVTFNTPKSSL